MLGTECIFSEGTCGVSRWRELPVAAHSVILAVYLLHVRHHTSLACTELLSSGRRRDKQIHAHKMSFGDSATEKNKIGYKGMESDAGSVCNFRR